MDSQPFLLGVNYWASHAAVYMWREWDAAAVAQDLRALAALELRTLRVFPLWPDFQPLEAYVGCCGELRELRGPEDAPGDSGLDPVMLDRFGAFLDLAEAQGCRVIVALLTGWMSGQLFAPAALANRNLITDPVAVQWEVRMVREFARRFREHPALLAWELGNECNCLARIAEPAEGWRWVQALADAIRAEDSTHPVLSGMWTQLHGQDPWRVEDLAENCDGLTAHTYPAWVPHVEGWPLGDTRQSLAPAAAVSMYADLGGKPVLVEEIGSLGPMFGDEGTRAAHARANLWNLWAHRGHGLLWWCGFDLTRARGRSPYDANAIEPKLGLLDEYRQPYPVAEELREFSRLLATLPPEVAALPAPEPEAVCVLTPGQDQWAAGLMAFLLAREAGFGLRFSRTASPLPEAPLYLLPSLAGLGGMPEQRWAELRERVAAGATLYVSLDDGALVDVEPLLGLAIRGRGWRTAPVVLEGEGFPKLALPPSDRGCRYEVEPREAEVLARDGEGRPVLLQHAYGAGRVYTLLAGLETGLAQAQDLPGAGGGAFAAIYRKVAEPVLQARVVRKAPELTWLGVTLHRLAEDDTVAVLVNDSAEVRTAEVEIAAGTRAEVLWGEGEVSEGAVTVRLPEHGGAVVRVRK